MTDIDETARPDPGSPGFDPSIYLEERYLGAERASGLLRLYYALKPLMPRRVQLALRRLYAHRQASRTFPAWPIEPVLVEHERAQLRRRLDEAGTDRLPVVGPWPEGKRFAVILTHDVEGPAGVENIPRVLDLERRYGFVSSFNFVAEWYPIPEDLFDLIRSRGCEIGLHGITHDGKLFQSRANFERDLPKLRQYFWDWGAVGFRSPATHRNADWMPELRCLYDTSFPDTDPFEPQSGGCCSIFPFFLDDLVELPITLPQDHTLWEILRDPTIQRWVDKCEWIIENHGLINVIVHPDYIVEPDRLALYEEFLAYLRSKQDGWHALPRDVAGWWQERAGLRVETAAEGREEVVGRASYRPTLAHAVRDGDAVRLAFESAPVPRESRAPAR